MGQIRVTHGYDLRIYAWVGYTDDGYLALLDRHGYGYGLGGGG